MKAYVDGQTPELMLLADILHKIGVDVTEGDAPAGVYDAVARSSDAATERPGVGGAVVCDIAGGVDLCAGDNAVLPEYDLQSVTGLVDTTGFPDGAPVHSRVPFIALSTALHAACALLAAALGGAARVEVSRYLSAVNALTTFLPAGLQGHEASRIGNAHPASSPWNAYPTADGWVLICTSKDEQWRRLCEVADHPPLSDPRYALHAARIAERGTVDALLTEWTLGRNTADCASALGRVGVPVGPILRVPDLAGEANVLVRQPALVKNMADSAADLFRAVTLFEDSPLAGQFTLPAWRKTAEGGPLAGLRVVEIGQFTTVPLAGRHLAHLGASVLKIEPPGGEPARGWKPLLDGVSHYYTLTNAGKEVQQLDMRDKDRLAWLRDQIAGADVLIENMRPGVLAQFGLSRGDLAQINPRLVACSVSGFGARSAYPGRAAFDTVVQGMSGIMDMTRSGDRPVKLGISGADILGAQVTLLAVLSALSTGMGRFIDIAMQDVAIYAALCGLMPGVAPTAPVRTVREIAQNPAFRAQCLTTISDEMGVQRPAVRLPYTIFDKA
jgi:crotonobetainyl-CoA:carnitine CoA-transferase CaiB-like acyl-CoA transferase